MTEPRDEPLERYRGARDEAANALAELHAALRECARWYDASADLAELERQRLRLREGRFVLAVVGEFSSGKSFLLNALLGHVAYEERAGAKRIVGLLATDINPSTATITELSHGTDVMAVASFPDGRQERIPLGRLARFVAVADEAKLHDATGPDTGAPSLVQISIDSPFLANGFVVADTPGLASINPAHRRATLSYLPGVDAVLYLVDTQQPFSAGDATFLGIVRRYIESIFIVQTKIDLWRMRDGERETWQNATARIVAQAAIHAPRVPVFPLSAREYAEGLIDGDRELIARSGFGALLRALDAALIATTGRARLRRAAAEARRLATRAAEAHAGEIAALERDPADLRHARDALEPALATVAAAAALAAARLTTAGAALNAETLAAGAELRARLQRALARAFDVADIARLRDRAKLHLIVDATLATTLDDFATQTADRVAERLRSEARAAVDAIAAAGNAADASQTLGPSLTAIAAERFPVAATAAEVFGADPASGPWSAGLESGLRSSIVFGALGGPAVGLVAAIAARFAAAPYGAYMKRELLADLGGSLFADFDRDVEAYVAADAARFSQIATRLATRAAALAERVRSEALAAIDAALTALAAGTDRGELVARAHEQSTRVNAIATRIEAIGESFAQAVASVDPAPVDPAALAAARPAAADGVRFDPQTYEHGLRPERWRVAVLGGLRRGKSGLINALAGARVLPDEGRDVAMRFPVHVRYGAESRAYALADDATWEPIGLESALVAATRTPVLIETPWDLPRQLVLVHTPAFDSGEPDAEAIALAAASGANEQLALFSRQLSDGELDVYARIARLGKPISFAHTLADNEAQSERRSVVALADRYLRERGIVPQRVFTVSTTEYRAAQRTARAPAAWNELEALRDTLAAHAAEHMARLERAERERSANERLAQIDPHPRKPAAAGRKTLLERLFGRQ